MRSVVGLTCWSVPLVVSKTTCRTRSWTSPNSSMSFWTRSTQCSTWDLQSRSRKFWLHLTSQVRFLILSFFFWRKGVGSDIIFVSKYVKRQYNCHFLLSLSPQAASPTRRRSSSLPPARPGSIRSPRSTWGKASNTWIWSERWPSERQPP